MRKTVRELLAFFMAFLITSTVYAGSLGGTLHRENTGTTTTGNDIPYDRWMSTDSKIQNSSLNQITIPGAHDAGMGESSSCSDYANKKVTKTQDKSMLQMLNTGTRYFDLRPIVNKQGNMYLGHFSWIGKDIESWRRKYTLRNEGCFGYSVDQTLDDVKTFVSNSSPTNREIVILKFSHFMNFKDYDNKDSHFDQKNFDQLEAKIISKLNGYLVIGKRDIVKIPIRDLTSNGPKVIVTFDASGYDGSKGIYAESSLNLYDKYSHTNDLDRMKADQLHKLGEYSSSTYFLLSWTLTQNQDQAIACMIPIPGLGCKTIEELAASANQDLGEAQNRCIETMKYPNVLYTDFISDSVTRTAITLNKARLQQVGAAGLP